MNSIERALIALCLGGLLLSGCGRRTPPPAADAPATIAVEPRLLPLAGPVASPEAEISAMCWLGDRLLLVPQHPERFATDAEPLGLLVLDRAEIEAVIDHRSREPLRPRAVVLDAPDLIAGLPGWGGLEAAVASGDTVYFAVEARVDGVMTGYLLRGRLDASGEPLRLRLDMDRVASIPVPTSIPNMSQEALVLSGGRLGVLFEANGARVFPGAHAVFFDRDLDHAGIVPIEPIEYRITDACQPDADGVFWVINYFFPGEGPLLDPPSPPSGPVEQLVALQDVGNAIIRAPRPALDLRRDPDQPPRNWEALVRLGDHGFLIMTDRYPTTLLAYVPLPTDATDGGD